MSEDYGDETVPVSAMSYVKENSIFDQSSVQTQPVVVRAKLRKEWFTRGVRKILGTLEPVEEVAESELSVSVVKSDAAVAEQQ